MQEYQVDTITIRITSSKNPSLWYTKHIGELFTVERVTTEHNGIMYWVRERNQFKSINIVHSCDAEVVIFDK